MLELCNASFNFYMYCICNKDIRSHFWKLVVSMCQRWKNINEDFNGDKQRNSISSKQRKSSVTSDFFNRIRVRKNSVLPFPWAKVRDSLTGTTHTSMPKK